MKIVAIVVTYNGMKWCKKCFDSLKHSSIPVDIIVIDNRSSDETVSFIKNNYPEIYLIESNENLGFGKANNIGLKYALENKADYVFLLNQDAWIKSNTIENLVNEMKLNPEYGILSPIHLSGEQDKIDKNFLTYISENQLLSDLLINGKADDRIYDVNFVNAALWLISSTCLRKVGGFNPLFPHYGEDNDYINRMNIHGFKVGVYPYTFGIHDRPQLERPKTFKQKKSRYYIKQLISLTNLSFKFTKVLYWTLLTIFIDMISNLIQLQLINLCICITTFFRVIYIFPDIIKKRKQARLSGMTFLI